MSRIGGYVLVPLLALCRMSSAAESAVGQWGHEAERAGALYVANCAACHAADGTGHSGTFPPLKGSRVVTKDDAAKHIQVVLVGLRGAKVGGVLYAAPMPSFGASLNDAEIADIINYERSSWGNHGRLVTAPEVAAQRGQST